MYVVTNSQHPTLMIWILFKKAHASATRVQILSLSQQDQIGIYIMYSLERFELKTLAIQVFKYLTDNGFYPWNSTPNNQYLFRCENTQLFLLLWEKGFWHNKFPLQVLHQKPYNTNFTNLLLHYDCMLNLPCSLHSLTLLLTIHKWKWQMAGILYSSIQIFTHINLEMVEIRLEINGMRRNWHKRCHLRSISALQEFSIIKGKIPATIAKYFCLSQIKSLLLTSFPLSVSWRMK